MPLNSMSKRSNKSVAPVAPVINSAPINTDPAPLAQDNTPPTPPTVDAAIEQQATPPTPPTLIELKALIRAKKASEKLLNTASNSETIPAIKSQIEKDSIALATGETLYLAANPTHELNAIHRLVEKEDFDAKIDGIYSTLKTRLTAAISKGEQDSFNELVELSDWIASFQIGKPTFKDKPQFEGDSATAKANRASALKAYHNHNHPYSGAVKMLAKAFSERFPQADAKTSAKLRQLKNGSVSVVQSSRSTIKAPSVSVRRFAMQG